MQGFSPLYIAQLVNPVLRSNLQSTANEVGWNYFNQMASLVVNIVLIVAVVIFAFVFIVNAVKWIVSGGDKGSLEDARKGISNAVIGLIVLLVVYALVRVVNSLLGLNIGGIGAGTNMVNVAPPDAGFQNLTGLTYQSFLTTGIRFVLVFAVIVFFFMFLTGGIRWITSAGDKLGIESARKTLTNAIVGLIIVFSIFLIIYIINTIFNVNLGGLGTGPTP